MPIRGISPSGFAPAIVGVLLGASLTEARQTPPAGGAKPSSQPVAGLAPSTEAQPIRVVRAARTDPDRLLARPWSREVPFGPVGRRLWASAPSGWAFPDDLHWVYLTNLAPLELKLEVDGRELEPADGTASPSGVRFRGASPAPRASASFTYASDRASHPLQRPFEPGKRWTAWSSGNRDDWYAVEFSGPRSLAGVGLWWFDDTGIGACRRPESVRFEGMVNGTWRELKAEPLTADQAPGLEPGETRYRFVEPMAIASLRIRMRHAGEQWYSGLFGIEGKQTDGRSVPFTETEEPGLLVTGGKTILADDIALAYVTIRNTGDKSRAIRWTVGSDSVDPSTAALIAEAEAAPAPPHGSAGKPANRPQTDRPTSTAPSGNLRMTPPRVRIHHGFAVEHRLALRTGPGAIVERARAPTPPVEPAAPAAPGSIPAKVAVPASVGTDRLIVRRTLAPGESFSLRAAVGFSLEAERAKAEAALRRAVREDLVEAGPPFGLAADFDCSDPRLTRMYWHRVYNLFKNAMDPKLGRLRHRTFAEGRWRSDWYSNVISYGAPHQIREARWLADPSYSGGHLETFTENPKADGVFPSHIRPDGQKGGQYTEWISSTAFDLHLVHPDRERLKRILPALAANTRGWRKSWDPDGDGLLMVDSHWWTGMEWQPSFFAFSDYRTDPKDRMQPAIRSRLERVDLTAYNFGNAVAVARLARELGQTELAAEFDALAAKIRSAVERRMWDPADRFFYSVRFEDKRKADVQEVVGVYPFYFGMFPAGSGHERAWEAIIDPARFWTRWPVASSSMKNRAFSQEGWPVGPGGSGCMWNGPTWPHANSIVLTAMARTLREHRAAGKPAPFDRRKLLELFDSFTLAQFQRGRIDFPWTGEFYRGDNADWKTAERDYNHSTWLDLLIPDLLGLVPREDGVLEIDPLLPADRLSWFKLDGQRYRGHWVTILWDDPADPEDRFGDRRRGLDVYLDGKLVGSSPQLERLLIPAPELAR